MSDTSDQKREPEEPLPEGVILRDHEYDGIQEYDQKLPNWWLFTLYIMVVCYVFYWFLYYQANLFRTDAEAVDAKIESIEQEKAAKLKQRMTELNDDVFWDLSRNSVFVSNGKATFDGQCATCHGKALDAKGLGGVPLPGLPLHDTEWKYSNKPMEIFNLVMNGSPDITKGMPPWKNLGTEKVVEVVSYVLSKHEPPAKTETPADDEAQPIPEPAPESEKATAANQ